MMKILITGANGFIGKNLVSNYKKKYSIYQPGRSELDFTDQKGVESYLTETHFDIVIHCAKRDDVTGFVSDYEVLNSNLRMFFNLQSCSSLYGKMFYLGSGAEYDSEHYKPYMNENYFGKYIPKNSYGFSKYIMSCMTEYADNIYDLRLFGVFGKYEAWSRRFISNAICKAILDIPITINQNIYFDYLYIDDFIKILDCFLIKNLKYKHYNICRGKHIDLFTLAKLIRDISGKKIDIINLNPKIKTEYSGNNRRMMDELSGNFEFTSFRHSVECLFEYYNENIDLIDKKLLI